MVLARSFIISFNILKLNCKISFARERRLSESYDNVCNTADKDKVIKFLTYDIRVSENSEAR